MGTLRLKVIVPITGWNEAFAQVPWMVQIEPTNETGLSKLSAADTFQIRSVSKQRLIKQIGVLPAPTMREIGRSIAIVLNIGETLT
jgi:mRNA interferase MazF